jgi:hypothetical protein
LNGSPPAALSENVGGLDGKRQEQGIVLDKNSQEQPKDKKRAQSATKPDDKDDEMQPVREKSGF